MNIRKMKDSDFGAIRKIISICFNIPLCESDEEAAALIATDKSILGRNYYNRLVAENEDGVITSTLRIAPYKASFDGGEIKIADIGAVASLPEYRNRGTIRECFRVALGELYKDDFAFSYVQAFSTAYYKKFGYAPAAFLSDWEIKTEKLKPAELLGSYEPVNAFTNDAREVYGKMKERFSLLAERTPCDWEAYEKNYLCDKFKTYLYRDENGEPKSFFTYEIADENGERILDMKERVYFYDKEGFLAILNFAASKACDFGILRLAFSTDANLDSLLAEHARFAITKKVRSNGMARCVNLESALNSASFIGSGRLVLEIKDEMIPENSGKFAIEFKDGALSSLYKTEDEADAKMGIDVFTALLLGRYEECDFEFIDGLEIFKNRSELKKIFYRKRIASFHCL